MGENKLNDIFKYKLEHLQTPVDTDELWSGIQTKQMDEMEAAPPIIQNNSREWLNYLGLFLFMIVLLTFGWFMSETPVLESDTSLTVNENTKSAPDQLTGSYVLENKAAYPKSNNAIVYDNEIDNEVDKEVKKEASASNVQPLEVFSGSSALIANNEEDRESFTKVHSTTNETLPAENASIVSTQLTSELSISNNENSSNILKEDLQEKSELIERSSLENIDLLEISGSTPLISDGRLKLFKDNIECYDPTKKKGGLAVQVYGGVDFVLEQLSTQSNDFENYLLARDNSSSFLEVIKGGAALKYTFTPNWYAKAGLEYNKINERFDFETQQTEFQTLMNQPIEIIITETGTDTIYGDVEVPVISSKKWQVYNTYHSFNIPVVLGYQSPLAGNLSWFGEAGLLYNYKFSFEGMLLDPQNQPIEGENYYVGKIGTSAIANLGLQYNLTKSLGLFTNASFKYHFNPINSEINPIDQKIGLLGAAVGLEWKF